MKPPCPKCGRTHAGDWTRAIGRFDVFGTVVYVANYPDSPRRATRAEAEDDMCQWWQQQGEK